MVLAGVTFCLFNYLCTGELPVGSAAATALAGEPVGASVPGTLSLIAGKLDGPGATDGDGASAQFGDGHTQFGNRPMGITSDELGNLYVADVSNHTIRKVSRTGVVTTIAGKAGMPGNMDSVGSDARFNSPSGIAINAEGRLYVADTGNGAIRTISTAGVVTTLVKLTRPEFGNVTGTRVEIRIDGHSTGGPYKSQDVPTQSPMGIAVDAKGNVYVSNTFANTILKIDRGGKVSTIAGKPGSDAGNADGTGAAASFNFPKGITVDKAGTLYVADCGNNAIRKISPDGVVTTVVDSGSGLASSPALNCPTGITVDKDGIIFVADEATKTVRKINSKGAISILAGQFENPGSADGFSEEALFSSPTGVAFDKDGNVYVADPRNAAIRKISVSGRVTTIAGKIRQGGTEDGMGAGARFHHPWDIAADRFGNLFVADTRNGSVRKITPKGMVTTIATVPAMPRVHEAITGITVDVNGNIYFAGDSSHVIRRIDSHANVLTLAGALGKDGSDDGPGKLARFNHPFRVTSDRSGNIYVADMNNFTVRKIDVLGVVTTIAGKVKQAGNIDGVGQSARFHSMAGIAVDNSGNIYIADNSTIRKIDPGRNVTTLAGQAGKKGNVDGIGKNATFDGVGSIALDDAGNIYVCDGGNTIRKITPTGLVSTVAGVAGESGLVLGSPGRLEDPTGLTYIGPKTFAVTTANVVLKLTLQ